MFRIDFLHPMSGSSSYQLRQDLVVGRQGGEADIQLDDRHVSKRHGRLWTQDGSVFYEDLGSRNGSWVGGARLSGPIPLRPGQPVSLGDTRMVLNPEQQLDWPGAEVCHQGVVSGHALTEALVRDGQAAATYVSALYGLTQNLLRSPDLSIMPEALQRLRQVLPSPASIALVGWPPQPSGALPPLCEGLGTPAVSTTLARTAVEQGRALMVSSTEMTQALAAAPSVLIRGIRSAIYVPLQDDEVRGLLCVDSTGAPFTLLDFQFLCAVGGLLATKLGAEAQREHSLQVEARRQGLASFLQIASHDLKNPLTAILNCAKLLKRKPDDHLLDLILGAAGRAQELICTYLDAAALDSGKPLEVHWESVDVRELVEEELSFLSASRRDRLKGFEIQNQVPAGCIQADPGKLRQIFANLLSNAVKYSPCGGRIVVGAQVTAQPRFWVTDQGVGIAPEDLPRLFEPFERVGDHSLAPGSGLGLWLTAALVQAHGGRLEVQSQPGKGSEFSFGLPQPVRANSATGC